MIAECLKDAAHDAVAARVDLDTGLLAVGGGDVAHSIGVDGTVVELNAVGDVLHVLLADGLVGPHLIDFLLYILRMGQLGCQVTVVGEQQHTGGVAVQSSHGVDALLAGTLHEVHDGLAAVGIVAGGDAVLGFVQQDVALLLGGYDLAVILYDVLGGNLHAEFGNDLAIDFDKALLDVFISHTARADAGVGHELVQAYLHVGIDSWLLIDDALGLGCEAHLGLGTLALGTLLVTALLALLVAALLALLVAALLALLVATLLALLVTTLLTGLITALLTGLITALLTGLVTALLTGLVATLALLIAALALLVTALTGLVATLAGLITALTGLVALLFGIVGCAFGISVCCIAASLGLLIALLISTLMLIAALTLIALTLIALTLITALALVALALITLALVALTLITFVVVLLITSLGGRCVFSLIRLMRAAIFYFFIAAMLHVLIKIRIGLADSRSFRLFLILFHLSKIVCLVFNKLLTVSR